MPSLFSGFDQNLFLSTFALVFVAELPDKTALATVLLAIRYHPFAVFAGVASAFVVQSIVAVSFGTAIGLLPHAVVQVIAGSLFLVLAVLMWTRHQIEEEPLDSAERRKFLPAAWASFVVIFLAEWGDLTQIATATLAARYPNPFTILVAAILALWAVTAIGIAIGHYAKRTLDVLLLQRLAALTFAAVGIVLLLRA